MDKRKWLNIGGLKKEKNLKKDLVVNGMNGKLIQKGEEDERIWN